MSDGHDSGAAGRLERAAKHWRQWQDTAALAFPVEDVLDRMSADALAVLAENEAMRKQIAALKTVWESIYSSGEYRTKTEALAAATRDRFGTTAVDEDVMWRLVGPWQPAEGGEQP